MLSSGSSGPLKLQGCARLDADRRKLEDVQQATKAEIERFRGYGSAKEVVENFRRDLSSAPAKKIHSELRALDLPVINDLKAEFGKKAGELGVDT